MNVLITGGAGFIGSHLCERLFTEKKRVIAIDNFVTGNRDNIKNFIDDPNFRFIEHDIVNPIDMDEKVDLILHFASPASPIDYANLPIETMLVNSIGTLNMLEIARKNDCRILVASTSEVYGDPDVSPQKEEYHGNVNPIGPRSCYDESKRFSEALTMSYSRVHGIKYTIIRIFNTYGPRMRLNDGRVIPNFISECLNNRPITIYGDGKQTRSFCYVEDLVEGIDGAVRSEDTIGQVINLGNPFEITVLELSRYIKTLCNSSSDIVFMPLPKDDPLQRRPDISKAKALLGWEPKISLQEGLRRTIEFFAKNHAEYVNVDLSALRLKKLSVIMPVFNEKNTILEVITRVKYTEVPDLEKEMIVVDDGSTDGTKEILSGLSDPSIKIILHEKNRGKGAAIRTGISVAAGDYIIIQDADMEYDPHDYRKMLKPIIDGKAQVVYGSRFTGERRDMLFWHMLGNKLLSLVTNVLYNTTISDMETGYKLFTRESLEGITLRSNRFEIEPELTAKFCRKGLRIYEVPVSYTGREKREGKKISWRDGIIALWTLFKYRFIS